MANWARASALCLGEDDSSRSEQDSKASRRDSPPNKPDLVAVPAGREPELSGLLSAKVAFAAHQRAAASAALRLQNLAEAHKEVVSRGPETADRVRAARTAAEELNAYFKGCLENRHILIDRLRPRSAAEAIPLSSDLHEPVIEFVTSILQADLMNRNAAHDDNQSDSVQAARWLSTFAPDDKILDAQTEDAASFLAELQASFNAVNAAHDKIVRFHDQVLQQKSGDNAIEKPP